MHPKPLDSAAVTEIIRRSCSRETFRGKRVLVIVPDGTRTAPIGLVFEALFAHVGQFTSAFDVLVALGTHQPMDDGAICRRLDISQANATTLTPRSNSSITPGTTRLP